MMVGVKKGLFLFVLFVDVFLELLVRVVDYEEFGDEALAELFVLDFVSFYGLSDSLVRFESLG